MSAKHKLRIGIVAFTKEKAEQYAAKWHLPSNAWYHIPVTDKITGLRAEGLVFDDVPIAKAQQALEALEWHYHQGHSNTLGGMRLKIDEKALRNLKAALAEPEPPIGKASTDVGVQVFVLKKEEPCPCGDRPAAQCPGEWEPGCDLGNNPEYAKRVNLAEPVQEPVAWGSGDGYWIRAEDKAIRPDRERFTVAFYTSPPQRKPLTEDEIGIICASLGFAQISPVEVARAIEAAHGIKEGT